MAFYYRRKRPKTRGECQYREGICACITCKWHLLWESPIRNKLKYMKTDDIIEYIGNMKWTCVLDAADEEGLPLEEVAQAIGVTRERVRQIEGKDDNKYVKPNTKLLGIRKIKRKPENYELLKQYLETGTFRPPPPVKTYSFHEAMMHIHG